MGLNLANAYLATIVFMNTACPMLAGCDDCFGRCMHKAGSLPN